MKIPTIILSVCITILFLPLDGMSQVHNSAERNNFQLKIPERIKKIDQEGNKHVFKDAKTKSILTFEKIDSYVFENLLGRQLQDDMNRTMSNPENVDVRESEKVGLMGTGYTIDWNTLKEDGEKIANGNRSILMEINGTLYRFTMKYKIEHKKTALVMLDKILDSSIPLYKDSYFSN